MASIDKDAFKMAVGGLVGANVIGNDETSLSTFLGIGVGAGVAVMGDFNFSDEMKDRGLRRATKDTVRNIDGNHIVKGSSTTEEKTNRLLEAAKKYAKNNLNSTSTTLDSKDILGSLNSNTISEYEGQLKNLSKESITSHSILFKESKDIYYNPKQGIDASSLINMRTSRLSADADNATRLEVLANSLEEAGYKRGSKPFDVKMERLAGLVTIPDTIIDFKDGSIKIGDNVDIKLTSRAVGENGVITPFHISGGKVEDVKMVNPMGGAILDEQGKTWKAVATALGPDVMKAYGLQEMAGEIKGLAPDEAIGLAQRFLTHLPPEDQVKALGKISEAFNKNFSFNAEATDKYRDDLGRGIVRPKITPTSYSGYRGSTVDYGDVFNFLGDTSKLQTEEPIRKLGTTSKNGITKSENKQLFEKLINKNSMLSVTGRKADDPTTLPANNVYKRDEKGRINKVSNPYNEVFSYNADHGRDIGVVNNRAESTYGISEDNRIAKQLYNTYGGKDQYNTSVALRSQSLNPEAVVDGKIPTTLGSLLGSLFGSNVTTADGFGLLSKDAAASFIREGKETAYIESVSTVEGDNFAIKNDTHRELLRGNTTIGEIKSDATKALTTLSQKTSTKLSSIKDTFQILKTLKDASTDTNDFINKLQGSNLFPKVDFNKYLGSEKQLYQDLDTLVLGNTRKNNNVFVRGNSSNSYKDALTSAQDTRQNIIKNIKGLSTNSLDSSLTMLTDLLSNNSYTDKIKDSVGAYYLVPGSTLGYNGDSSPVKVPSLSTHYTLSSASVYAYTSSAGDFNFNKVMFGFDSKLEADKLDFLKIFSVSSKAQVGIIDQEQIAKSLMLRDLTEEGRLKVDTEKEKIIFKLKNEKYTTQHSNFINAVSSIDRATNPLLHNILETKTLSIKDIDALKQEAKQAGIAKELDGILRPLKNKINSPNSPNKIRALEGEFKYKRLSFDQFVNTPLKDMFSTPGISRKVVTTKTKVQTSNPKLTPKPAPSAFGSLLASSLEGDLKRLYGDSIGTVVSQSLGKTLSSTFNTSISKLRAGSSDSFEQILKKHVGKTLTASLNNGTIAASISDLVGSTVGMAIGRTLDGAGGKLGNATLGYVLDTKFGDTLGDTLGQNLEDIITKKSNKNSTGDSIGKAIGSQVGNNKVTANSIGSNFGNSIKTKTVTTKKVEFTPVIKPNSEALGFQSKYGTTSIIMDEDSTGGTTLKNLFNLFTQHKQPNFQIDLDTAIPSSVLRSTIVDQLNTRGNDKVTAEGLAAFAMSFSNKEKLAQSPLTTNMVNVQKTFEGMLSTYSNDTANTKSFKQLDSFVIGMTGQSLTDSLGNPINNVEQVATKAIKNELDFVHQYYGGSSEIGDNLFSLSKSPNNSRRLSDFYINATKYASDNGSSIIEASISGNPVPTANLGSTENTMSWMTSKQLRDSGFTLDELNLYGRINSNTAADHQIVSMLTNKQNTTINKYLDTDVKRTAFQRVLNTTADNRRAILAEQGIKVDGLVGTYKLQNKVENGFLNVPLILEDSNLFGTYMKDGQVKQKRVATLFDRMIETDMKISSAKTDKERDLYIKRQQAYTQEAKNHITPLLGGKDNLGKKLLTRDAVNSTYSRALPVTGGLEEFSKRMNRPSVASVSLTGLRHRLANVDKDLLGGVDITKLDDETLMKQSFLRRTQEGLHEVILSHKGEEIPLSAVLTREPSAGPGSSAITQILLDTESTAGKGYINTVGNSSFNKYFKFLDFDADQMLEAYPESNKNTFGLMKSAWEKGQKLNNELNSIIELTSYLGVKNKKGGLTSFLDIANDPNVRTAEDFSKALREEVIANAEKSATRKTISPSVTKASQQIQEAIVSSVKNGTSSADLATVLRARTISHYLTENLIKAMHVPTKEYQAQPVTVAERLSGHLNTNNISAFNRELGQHLEETLIKGRLNSITDKTSRDRLTGEAREAISFIQKSMTERNPEDMVATPVDLKPTKKFEEGLDNYQKLTGSHVANPTIEIAETGEEGVVHTAKKGYYTASETIKENFTKNKKLFLGAGAITAASALLLQKKPDFGENKAHANTNGMMMSGGRTALEETAQDIQLRNSSHPATEFLHKFGSGPKQISIDSERTGYNNNDSYQDMSSAITGGGMSSIRILTN